MSNKKETEGTLKNIDGKSFPSVDENGAVFIQSTELKGGTIVAIYAKKVPEGCDKRVLTVKDGVVVSDTTEFKRAAYIQEWMLDGIPYRSELIGGN